MERSGFKFFSLVFATAAMSLCGIAVGQEQEGLFEVVLDNQLRPLDKKIDQVNQRLNRLAIPIEALTFATRHRVSP